MKPTARLLDYAMDFEAAYKTDIWESVERHFAPDAKYEVRNTSFDCSLEGAENIINGFKKSLNGFDRQLKRIIHVIEGPHEELDSVSFVWRGQYVLECGPPLVLSARQTLCFREGRIIQLVDEFLDGYGEAARQWIELHAPHLDPAYE